MSFLSTLHWFHALCCYFLNNCCLVSLAERILDLARSAGGSMTFLFRDHAPGSKPSPPYDDYGGPHSSMLPRLWISQAPWPNHSVLRGMPVIRALISCCRPAQCAKEGSCPWRGGLGGTGGAGISTAWRTLHMNFGVRFIGIQIPALTPTSCPRHSGL